MAGSSTKLHSVYKNISNILSYVTFVFLSWLWNKRSFILKAWNHGVQILPVNREKSWNTCVNERNTDISVNPDFLWRARDERRWQWSIVIKKKMYYSKTDTEGKNFKRSTRNLKDFKHNWFALQEPTRLEGKSDGEYSNLRTHEGVNKHRFTKLKVNVTREGVVLQ